jgi:hypothetical protein
MPVRVSRTACQVRNAGKPFIWKAIGQDIIAKVQRGRTTLNQIKSQTDH